MSVISRRSSIPIFYSKLFSFLCHIYRRPRASIVRFLSADSVHFCLLDWIHDSSSKDTSSNATFGRIRQLVECNVWSKWTDGLNLYFDEMCLKLVENIKHLSRKKRIGINFILNSAGKSLANSFFRIFAEASCGGGFSYHFHRRLRFNLRYVRSMHIVACLLQYTIIRLCYNAALTLPIVTFPLTKLYHSTILSSISNNVVCATGKGSDQPAHMRSLIRVFASRLNVL